MENKYQSIEKEEVRVESKKGVGSQLILMGKSKLKIERQQKLKIPNQVVRRNQKWFRRWSQIIQVVQ